MFAFGENGIAFEQHREFRVLPFSNPNLGMAVTGLVEARNGDIWINGSRAIASISASEILAAASNRAHRMLACHWEYKTTAILGMM